MWYLLVLLHAKWIADVSRPDHGLFHTTPLYNHHVHQRVMSSQAGVYLNDEALSRSSDMS
jgi:hypothetical protein